MIGAFLLSLMLLPLSNVMTQSSTQTQVSFHEQQAVQYVRELLDQVAELVRNDTGPGLGGLVAAAGQPLPSLLPALTPALSDQGPAAPRIVPLGAGKLGLVVSPLVPPFQERFFRIDPIDATRFVAAPASQAFQVTAGVRWVPGGERSGRPIQTYEASIFLVEDR